MRTHPVLGVKGRVFAVLGLSLLLALAVSPLAARADSASDHVVAMNLTGVVDPFMASFVQRGIDHANAEGAGAVLLTIDTPGGLGSSMHEIDKAILASKVPVICYTSPAGSRAASAGTFIMMACPVNAMAPGTNIGAAHPVGVQGAIENEKVTNDAAATIRSLAEHWGRNADAAEKAVRNATSWSAEGAVNVHLVDLQESDTTALLSRIGACQTAGWTPPATGMLSQTGQPLSVPCNATLEPFKMTASESLFHAFADPNVAFLLLEIGFVALIVFVIHPGLHVSLAVGVICTVLGLAILETLPVQLVGFALLVVSAILFVLDVKAHAHGVLTTGGVVTLILGGLLLFNPRVPSAHVSLPLIIAVAVAIGLFMAFVVRALVSAQDEPAHSGMELLVGSTGTATSPLTPLGTVRARAESWTAESTRGAVPAGTPVRIVGVRGVKLLVEPVDPAVPAGSLAGDTNEGSAR